MIELKKITQDLIREYFKDFESDSDIYMDMSKFSEYRYDEEKVNAYFERISADTTRKAFIITEAGRPIGEICIKHINTAEKRGELSFTCKTTAVKTKVTELLRKDLCYNMRSETSDLKQSSQMLF